MTINSVRKKNCDISSWIIISEETEEQQAVTLIQGQTSALCFAQCVFSLFIAMSDNNKNCDSRNTLFLQKRGEIQHKCMTSKVWETRRWLERLRGSILGKSWTDMTPLRVCVATVGSECSCCCCGNPAAWRTTGVGWWCRCWCWWRGAS